jgi:hypothetical protein
MTTKIALTQIDVSNANAGSVLAVQAGGQLAVTSSISDVAGVVKISSVQIADASYNVLDDTAVSTSGGYIIINGSGFVSGCQVVIGSIAATSVTFISSTVIRAQVPAQAAGTYTVYVTNSDGGSAFRINGLTYSVFPTWATNSTLSNQSRNARFTVNLSANSDSNVTYSLVSGSTLPFGANLFANGLIVGNVYVANDTTYSFTVSASDQEFQNTNRQFSLTIVATEYNTATGGTVTEVVEGDGKTYRIHTFTSSNSFVVSAISGANGNAEIMVVAGGGAGGQRHGGGGGAGGMIGPRSINLSATTYTITIGAGGTGGTGGAQTLRGSNTRISVASSNVLLAFGGGGGYHASTSGGPANATAGGSGGGGGYGGTGAAGVPGQGSAGNEYNSPSPATQSPGTLYSGAGGGGASGTPNKGFFNTGKHGSYSFISGSNVAYAGGGGGGYYDSTPATTLADGGIGGGGSGYPSGYPGGFPGVAPFANGVANRGGGGGGAGTETQGGNGGSGIVIIKYPITGTL